MQKDSKYFSGLTSGEENRAIMYKTSKGQRVCKKF